VINILGIVDRCRRSAERVVSPIYSAALDFVYPPECLLCGRELQHGNFAFCELCLLKVKPRFANDCPRCGAPVGQYVDLTKGCGQCHRETFAFDRVIRLGVYDGEMRLACLRAKATGGSSVARGLAAILVNEKRTLFEDLGLDVAVPIPEHWTRRFLHPHYAAETISREIARQLNVRWGRNVLSKVRRTPKQATSPTPQRRQQQQGSFGVQRSAKLTGKTVLLIDDILTTGSTASAAARALKNAGAKRVIVSVIAVSPLRK
jgi:predicted amidophosphoribosyltransferase